MLINFTNHPAARWSEAQRMAARQYGAVVDLPFPEVDPAASETSLDAIASLYVRRILAMAPDAVLCQGECTLVYRVTRLLLVQGVRMDGAVKRYRQYLAVIGDRQSISFSQLAGVVGRSPKRVEDDLDAMITQGYFGPTAYLDLSLGYFFRSRTAAEEAAARRRAAAAPKEAEEGYAGILRAIRRANDAIADPVLSAKIDRLEEVTAQIFRIIEKDEKKESQVRMFLEYYLPTTQKLLDSYVEFEAAGVDGDNLRMAKEKIEETMDNIVRGFENQLDALYAAEAMDIQTDIDVMNNMMQRDSAMHTSDFRVDTGDGPRLTLDGEDEGAAAVQQRREG